MAKTLTLEQKITAGIAQHLLTIDLLPPTTNVTDLAGELTQVVFDHLQEAGVDLSGWTKIDVAVKRAGAPGGV
jgi:hypothetical protein